MEERRRFERFSINLPARLETIISDKKQIFELKTSNISASGAFFDTKSPFFEGTRFKLSLTAQSERIKELTGAQSFIECEGVVIRSTPVGIAICFDKDCQIRGMKNL